MASQHFAIKTNRLHLQAAVAEFDNARQRRDAPRHVWTVMRGTKFLNTVTGVTKTRRSVKKNTRTVRINLQPEIHLGNTVRRRESPGD